MAARLDIDEPDAAKVQPSLYPKKPEAFKLCSLDEDQDGGNAAGQRQELSSSSAFAMLRLVCKAWRNAIDHGLDHLTLSRSDAVILIRVAVLLVHRTEDTPWESSSAACLAPHTACSPQRHSHMPT